MLTHTWYKSNTEVQEVDVEDLSSYSSLQTGSSEVIGSTYEATAPGWYFEVVKSKLNRKEEVEATDVCRVAYKPNKPELVKMEYSPWTDAAYANPETYFKGDVWNIVDDKHLMSDTVASQ